MVAPCRTEYGTQTLHYAVPKLLNFLIVKELSLDTISYEALRSFFSILATSATHFQPFVYACAVCYR